MLPSFCRVTGTVTVSPGSTMPFPLPGPPAGQTSCEVSPVARARNTVGCAETQLLRPRDAEPVGGDRLDVVRVGRRGSVAPVSDQLVPAGLADLAPLSLAAPLRAVDAVGAGARQRRSTTDRRPRHRDSAPSDGRVGKAGRQRTGQRRGGGQRGSRDVEAVGRVTRGDGVGGRVVVRVRVDADAPAGLSCR